MYKRQGLGYVLACVRQFRTTDTATPVVLMGYLNPVEIRGAATFAQEAAQAGVDGMLLVDLPPEEADEYRAAFAHNGLALISLASPTTPQARLPVSYTHLDVYKRQVTACVGGGSNAIGIFHAFLNLSLIHI